MYAVATEADKAIIPELLPPVRRRFSITPRAPSCAPLLYLDVPLLAALPATYLHPKPGYHISSSYKCAEHKRELPFAEPLVLSRNPQANNPTRRGRLLTSTV